MRPLAIAAFLLCLAAPASAADPAPTAAASAAYVANNARQPGVTVRPSGLQTRIVKSGFGKRFTPGAVVQIYYTAKLVNGTVIDGTSPGLPAPIEPAATLKGLGEAIAAMREGDHWEVTLPPALAFGNKGSSNGAIPPEQALIFDITILTVEPAAAAATAAASNSGFGFTARNGESRAFWTIHP
jgi:FKBP-type peptidyl-prolyl cis-trans isomerase